MCVPHFTFGEAVLTLVHQNSFIKQKQQGNALGCNSYHPDAHLDFLMAGIRPGMGILEDTPFLDIYMERRSKFKQRLFKPAWKSRMEMRQLLGRGTPWELSVEDRAWLNAPPVGFEWPNHEMNGQAAVPREKGELGTLRPPPGIASWLDYAVEYMDTRELYRTSLFNESIWGYDVPREAFREAAQQELRALRALTSSTIPKMVSKMSEQEFADFLKVLFQFALEGGDLGYRYWDNVIQELKKMRKVLSATR